MKVLSDILHKAGILKEAAEGYSSGGYSVLVRNSTTQRLETVPSSSLAPSQSGNSGKYLTTDGSNMSWGTVPSVNMYNSNGTLTGDRTINAGGFTLTINPLTTFSGTATAVSSEAIAHKFTPTLTAAANSDRLIGLDILPTYNAGAFTGVGRWGLRTKSLWVNHDTWNALSVTPAIYVGDKDAAAFYVHPGIGTTDTTELFMRGNNPAFGAWYFTIKANYNVTISAGPYVENMYFNMGSTNAMTIKNTGNVIIGGSTDTALYKLDVQGAVRATGNGTFAGDITIGNTGGNRYINWALNEVTFSVGTTTATTIAIFGAGGITVPNLLTAGGGTTISSGGEISGYSKKLTFPAAVNHVGTHVLISQGDAAYGGLTTQPGNIWIYPGKNTTNNIFGNIHLAHNGTEARGNVAIGGSAAPAYRLDVTGTGRFTGALYSNTCIYATGNQSDGALNVSNPNTSGFSTVIINRADVTNCFGNIAFVDRKTGALGRGFSIGIGISGDPTWADGDFIIGNYTGTGGWTQSARIFNATGNWKIGSNTTDAGYKLDIVGTSRVQLPAVGTLSYFVLSSASATAFNSYFGVTGSDFTFSKGEYSWGTNLKFNGTTFVRDNTGVGSWMISQSCGNDVANHFFRIRSINPNVGTVNSSAFVIGGSGIVGINREPVSGVGLSVSGTIGGDGLIIDQSVSRYVLGLSSASLRLTLNDAVLPVFQIANSSSTAIVFNSTNSYASAQLAIDSTTRGFLPPRMTTTQKTTIASPAAGLVVYDNTDNYLSLYNGTNWQNIVSPNSVGNVMIGTVVDGGQKFQVNGTSNFSNKLSVIATATTNDVALFMSVEPYITIEAAGGSNSASIFLKPSTAAQNATIQNRSGGGLEFYVNANYTTAKMTIKGTTVNIASLPTSSTGLSSGDIWNDAGTLKVA